MSGRFVPDSRYEKAPRLPGGRPATRREVWERWHAVFYDRKSHRRTQSCTANCNHKSPGELEAYCRDAWVWSYVSRFIYGGWDKQPEWVEGDPVIPEAVPDATAFPPGESGNWTRVMQACMETANRLLPERREQQLTMKEAA